jgi:hypothetical protein
MASSSTISLIENLESRTMLSAVSSVHAGKVPAVKAPLHAPVIRTVDPKVTKKSITYQSFASDPLFASDGPTISDVNQGELGDCYLLSTLSSVVKTDPRLIEKDIVSDGAGIYTVTFGGAQPKKINVNADLPVQPDGQLAYAQLGDQNSLWVALMEKAYVQYTNPRTDAYASINGGWMTSAFTALGLKSSSIFSAANAGILLKAIQKDLKAGDFVTFGTDNKLSKNSPLIADHAYEVDAVNTNSAGVPVSVTLRNPWGDAVADDGLITITATQLYSAFSGAVIGHA